jgi:choline-glycine betaine transporter
MNPCEQHDAIKEIRNDIKDIKHIVVGNGKMGIAEMARRAFEYTERAEVSKNGILDWAFRTVVAILLAYIAVRMGIK